jgi:hypothetical protein
MGMSTAHTATPYIFALYGAKTVSLCVGTSHLPTAKKDQRIDMPRTEVNIAFVQKAVAANNAHDDLVKDGKRLQFVIDNGMPMCNGGRFAHLSAPGTWFDTAREAIDAALAKAGAQ